MMGVRGSDAECSALRADLDAILADRFFGAGVYVNPAMAAVEREWIFARTWQYVGDGVRLAPGSIWAVAIAGREILITRTIVGELKAFHNVCPHRAALLQPEPGIHANCKHLICPYHAWAYDLDGQLVGVPGRDRFSANFDPTAYPLQAVRCEEWSGFIFICLDAEAPPLQEALGEIPARLSGHRRPETTLLAMRDYDVPCNWKVYHDNTLCDYHVAIVHRETLHPIQGPIRRYEHIFDRYVNLLYTPTTPAWRSQHGILDGLDVRARQGFFTYGIFPNLHLLAMPDGLLGWLRILPGATVGSCRVRLELYGIPSVCPPTAELERDFEAFMQEDMEVTAAVQRGYASGAYAPGPIHDLEARIRHQQRLLRAYLLAAPELGSSSIRDRRDRDLASHPVL